MQDSEIITHSHLLCLQSKADAPVFGADIRRFESFLPSQFFSTGWPYSPGVPQREKPPEGGF